MRSIQPSLLPALGVCAVVCVIAGAQAGDLDRGTSTEMLEQELRRLDDSMGEEPSRLHHERAEVLFRLGRFEEATRDYNSAAAFGWPHNEDSCWERGLAQYYAGAFEAGAEQFERYHRVGPLDIENGLWRLLCIAEIEGLKKARESMLEYPRRVRPPFPALLDLYLGEGSEEDVLAEAAGNDARGEDDTRRSFNAHYYLGKYYEIVGDRERALEQVKQALNYPIAHFMYFCAQIDAERLEEGES